MKDHILEAQRRCRSFLRHTPMERCPFLSTTIDADVYLKMEQQQVTGSFKARGAFNKILSLSEAERKSSFFVAASTGNHAAAFCHVLSILGLKGKVFLPENVARAKLEFIESFGIPYELHGRTSLQTEIYSRKIAMENGYVLVHPYNDAAIIAGQGTIGIELLQDLPDLDCVLVPVGGGGLIAGIASYLKAMRPGIQVIGCQPRQSPEMMRSIELGRIITDDMSNPTISDGTAGGIEENSITFPICQDLVDRWVLIEESDIAEQMRWMISHHQTLVEGAACLSIAALHILADELKGKKVACIICGKRISMEKLQLILCS